MLSLLKNDRNSQEMLSLLEQGMMKDVLSSGDNFTLLVPENSAFKVKTIHRDVVSIPYRCYQCFIQLESPIFNNSSIPAQRFTLIETQH